MTSVGGTLVGVYPAGPGSVRRARPGACCSEATGTGRTTGRNRVALEAGYQWSAGAVAALAARRASARVRRRLRDRRSARHVLPGAAHGAPLLADDAVLDDERRRCVRAGDGSAGQAGSASASTCTTCASRLPPTSGTSAAARRSRKGRVRVLGALVQRLAQSSASRRKASVDVAVTPIWSVNAFVGHVERRPRRHRHVPRRPLLVRLRRTGAAPRQRAPTQVGTSPRADKAPADASVRTSEGWRSAGNVANCESLLTRRRSVSTLVPRERREWP